jgi:alpha-ketoglutarate-dependent 2,4-dichlorophenoxyacetate dioxygenase
MGFAIKPFSPTFGVAFEGVDLSGPVDAPTLQAIIAAMDQYAVGVLRNAKPRTNAEHIAFSLQLGPIQRTPVLLHSGRKERLPDPEIIDQSNFDHEGKILPENDKRLLYKRANQQWHTDMSFHPVRATYSLLAAHVIPPSGADTEFADLRAAYDALPEETKRKLEGLVAEHSIFCSRAKTGFTSFSQEERDQLPPVPQVVVRTHPGSKRRTLYIASHADHIIGWPLEEGRKLLAELIEHATQRQFVYTHRWRVNDLVMWDDRCTMHRGRPFDDLKYKRNVQRTTVSDEITTIEREGIRLVA